MFEFIFFSKILMDNKLFITVSGIEDSFNQYLISLSLKLSIYSFPFFPKTEIKSLGLGVMCQANKLACHIQLLHGVLHGGKVDQYGVYVLPNRNF